LPDPIWVCSPNQAHAAAAAPLVLHVAEPSNRYIRVRIGVVAYRGYMNIAVIGTGYVGLVAGACFAETGNSVLGVDVDASKVAQLEEGIVPFYEPGLMELVVSNRRAKRLAFTTSLELAVRQSEIIFIAVGTPQSEDGSADLTHVLTVARDIAASMNGPKIVVNKSTVPVGTAAHVKRVIEGISAHAVEVVSNPEFLKEGAAIEDFMRPDRVVLGVSSDYAASIMSDLYAPFVRTNNPILIMDVASAEMTKYAANAMLATRISFMNEIANLCERVGADVDKVRLGVGTDSRIGMSFLFPGIGYGGSCFPKDVKALVRTGQEFGVDLRVAQAVEEVNARQKLSLIEKLERHFGTSRFHGMTVAVWGLAFKPRTDDVREAPAAVICRELCSRGARLRAFDPEAINSFQASFVGTEGMTFTQNPYEALEGADALVICTEWNAFRKPDFSRMSMLMKEPVIFDGRNIYHVKELEDYGFTYYSVGRPAVRGASSQQAAA
jgi:UDPglucose 6-dehydrogenase